MTLTELLEGQADLEQELRSLGPVGFIRALVARSPGAQVLAHDSQTLPGSRRATRFLFVDTAGGEALITVFSEMLADGRPGYSLTCEPRQPAGTR